MVKTQLKYHCWKCGDTDNMRGNLGTLIKKYGSADLYKQYKEEIENIRKSGLYFLDNPTDGENNALKETFIRLPKSYKKIDLLKLKYKKLTDYLNKRKIDQEIIDKFNIGFTSYNDEDWTMRSKIIIPSYDSFGDLNFFVGRDFTEKAKIKYKNCDADKMGIIFQESLIDWDADIYLVEGAIDCLYLPNSISLLGKTLSKKSKIFDSLLSKSNAKIVIALDGDTDINETKRIYSLLNFSRLRDKIFYIRMGSEEVPYKDFGDLYVAEGKRGMINATKTMKQFEEIELVF